MKISLLTPLKAQSHSPPQAVGFWVKSVSYKGKKGDKQTMAPSQSAGQTAPGEENDSWKWLKTTGDHSEPVSKD
jgi:hypothetical protein